VLCNLAVCLPNGFLACPALGMSTLLAGGSEAFKKKRSGVHRGPRPAWHSGYYKKGARKHRTIIKTLDDELPCSIQQERVDKIEKLLVEAIKEKDVFIKQRDGLTCELKALRAEYVALQTKCESLQVKYDNMCHAHQASFKQHTASVMQRWGGFNALQGAQRTGARAQSWDGCVLQHAQRQNAAPSAKAPLS